MASHLVISTTSSTKGTFFLLFVIIISLFQVSSGQQSGSSDSACGTLYYSQEAEAGGAVQKEFHLFDQDLSSNLYEDEAALENGWNVTTSMVVQDKCKMMVCNETYFDGTCQILQKGLHFANESAFMTEIASVECSCAKQCNCSDVHIKRSTCGRAYLEGGCSVCRTPYIDLSIDETETFPKDFMNNVKAILLRKGCTITLYPEEDFEGEENYIDQEIVEDFEGTIGSYTCSCDDSLYLPRVRPPRPESYPELINIPDSMDDVIKMLRNETYKNHPGLHAARKSYRHRRSHKNAYILLIGSTGAGKSSAVNLLFDNPNVTKVGGYQSTTSDIHEFRIPIPVDELGIANSELRVIDTPGLGDTRGLGQDARFLATLEKYLSNHEELKNRLPNAVFIFHKFSDNRFAGEGSPFVKMIRGLDYFRTNFADENYSNVIFAFSHFLSVDNILRRRPEKKLKEFKNVIQDYSLFPRPTHLVVAENKAKDYELPIVNGYFKLPNNEYYPRNLFEKLELVTQKGGDTVGLGVFRTAFRDSENFNTSASTFKLVESNADNVEKFLGILASANFGVQDDTEVSKHLNKVWNDQISPGLRTKFPGSLAYLKKALNLRNVNNMQDVPRTTPEILKLLTALKHDEATRTLLEKGLYIKSPEFPLSTIAGYSYNVFKDMPLTTSPFKQGDLQPSDIGFLIPKSLTCKLDPSSKEFFKTFDNRKGYLQHRLKSLGIGGHVPADLFTNDTKPGCNIRETSFRNDSCSISAAMDFRLFEFVLNDRLDLTPEFQRTVKALLPFNESDHTVYDQWKQFFNTYGTHVVKSVHGGGSIQVQLESNETYNDKLAHALFGLVKFAEHMTYDLEGSDDDTNSTITTLGEGTTQTMKFIGGNSEYHSGDLGKMSATEANTLLTNWKKSLKFNPAVLTTEMRLLPISQIVKKLGQNYTAEIERASELLFNSKLVYTPPKKHEGPGDSRDNTAIVQEMMMKMQESQERMLQMQKQMEEDKRKYEERDREYNRKLLEWQAKQSELERLHQERMANATAKAEQDRRDWQEQARLQKEQDRKQREKDDKDRQDLIDQINKARDKAEQDHKNALKELEKERNKPGCLKAGTKILMWDMSERSVETLNIGDIILDKDFQPTTVLGITKEYVLDQKFYGFQEGSYFFTDNHLFVGPSFQKQVGSDASGQEGAMKLYAASTFNLYLNNPLMAYLNVTEMMMSETENIKLYHVNKSDNGMMLASRNVRGVFPDPESFPVDTLMYDIQVDSPSQTYIANGYVCRHEIPPVEYWPNTMSIMFKLMSTPTFQQLPQIPFTVENVLKLQQIADDIAESVRTYLEKRITILKPDDSDQNGASDLMTLEDVNVEECISKIFSHPILSTTGVRLYARVGLVIANYLDNNVKNGGEEYNLSDGQVATLQHELYKFIDFELMERVSQFWSPFS